MKYKDNGMVTKAAANLASLYKANVAFIKVAIVPKKTKQTQCNVPRKNGRQWIIITTHPIIIGSKVLFFNFLSTHHAHSKKSYILLMKTTSFFIVSDTKQPILLYCID